MSRTDLRAKLTELNTNHARRLLFSCVTEESAASVWTTNHKSGTPVNQLTAFHRLRKTAALFVTRGMFLIKLFLKRTLVVNKEKIIITHKTIPGSRFEHFSIVLEDSKEYSQNTAAIRNGNLRKPREGNQQRLFFRKKEHFLTFFLRYLNLQNL